MATLSAGSSAAASKFCRPEEDPFLLESTLRSVQEILLRRRGLPLRRTWIEQPYGDEKITLLKEEELLIEVQLKAASRSAALIHPLAPARVLRGYAS